MWVALQAALEASSELGRLGVSFDGEIDIFSIIEDADLPLMFRPLRRLSGAYIPARKWEGSMPGVLIHSGHPRSLQRYTAAHEYAHHIHDRRLSLDRNTEVLQRSQQLALPPRERFAEVFAAWFLMPLQLVSKLMRILGIDVSRTDPSEVYELSLALGTSYRATISQLVALQVISASQASALRRYQPKQIKENLSWDSILTSPRNDVWVIDKAYDTQTVHPRMGDELYLRLPEMPSTGYIWTHDNLDPSVVPIGQRFLERNSSLEFGGEGTREFKFGLLRAGRVDLDLYMRRPWVDETGIADSFHMNLVVEGERLGINPNLLPVEA